jgi:Cu(I)/Ag(I) efflux system membrane protein CusA/SilA
VIVIRSGENALKVIDAVKQKIKDLEPGLPPGVRIASFYDRSSLIHHAVDTLKHALLEEILLVTLAHVIFLWHFRSILIVTLPLPLAVSVAFLSCTTSIHRTSCRLEESPLLLVCWSMRASL